MNVDLAQELLNQLGSSLEKLETQNAALLQFLKENGTLTDDKFAPYLAQAENASGVRWLAARLRLESLIRSEREKEEKLREEEQHPAGAKQENQAAGHDHAGQEQPQPDAGQNQPDAEQPPSIRQKNQEQKAETKRENGSVEATKQSKDDRTSGAGDETAFKER